MQINLTSEQGSTMQLISPQPTTEPEICNEIEVTFWHQDKIQLKPDNFTTTHLFRDTPAS